MTFRFLRANEKLKTLELFFVILFFFLALQPNSYAESLFSHITTDEFIACGYRNENEFIKHLALCLQIRDKLFKSGVCSDTSCLMATPDHIEADCDKNYDAFYYLVLIAREKQENQSKSQSSEKPLSEAYSNAPIASKSVESGDYEKGFMAFYSEDYDTAYALLKNYSFTVVKPLLGYMYLFGLGVEQNLEKAADLYLASAKTGDTEAEEIATALYAGDDIPEEKHGEETSSYPKISNKNEIFSQKKIIDIGYEKGIKAFENRNYKTAYQLLKNYKTSELPEAMPMLGLLTMLGYSPEQNIDIALELFLEAAKQGQGGCQLIIALTYLNGEGDLFPQNFDEASKWFLKAAESGYVYAQKKLGDMYVLGQGVRPDAASAKNWYSKASENGDEIAKRYLEILENYGLPSCARILTADLEVHHK
jgi:TPR repeat protein